MKGEVTVQLEDLDNLRNELIELKEKGFSEVNRLKGEVDILNTVLKWSTNVNNSVGVPERRTFDEILNKLEKQYNCIIATVNSEQFAIKITWNGRN